MVDLPATIGEFKAGFRRFRCDLDVDLDLDLDAQEHRNLRALGTIDFTNVFDIGHLGFDMV
jgi:hypothetical protein